MKPLTGLKVIDISRVLAGPYCGQLLADMGAEVIKIEAPEGDENRRWPPITEHSSTTFDSVNRGKKGLTLNLKAEPAQQILQTLLSTADVVVHNFLPKTASSLGLNEAVLRERYPRLIVCSITGYGRYGPLRDKPGYDVLLQAFSGIMSTTGYPDSPPVRVGVSFIDMSTGLSAYAAIVTALLARSVTGEGQHVHTSLLESAISWLGYHAVEWLRSGDLPMLAGSGVGHIVPYQAFHGSDGYIMVGATNDKMFAKLCDALAMPALVSDPRFCSPAQRVINQAALIPLLDDRFKTQSVQHWLDELEPAGIPVSPINTLDQILTHPQVIANGMVVEADAHGVAARLIGMPFKLGDDLAAAKTAAPRLGDDTEEILRSLAFSDAQISKLRADKVI